MTETKNGDPVVRVFYSTYLDVSRSHHVIPMLISLCVFLRRRVWVNLASKVSSSLATKFRTATSR